MLRQRCATSWTAIIVMVADVGSAHAQVPADIEAKLREIGQIVAPGCTAKLYRPLMPAKDYNTYWPVNTPAPIDLSPIYSGT